MTTLNPSIEYIRKDPLPLHPPPYRGQSYEVLAPDTLDLQERAALGINGLTGPTDPAANYELYWFVNFFRDPPIMMHEAEEMDTFQWTKFMEALPLLRLISGSALNAEVERVWFDVLSRMIGPDGLPYQPLSGRPWAREAVRGYFELVDPVWRADGSRTKLSDPTVMQYATPWMCARLLGAMTIYLQLDGNPEWRVIGDRLVQRVSELVVDQGDYCYFPEGSFEPHAKVPADAPMPKGLFSAISPGRACQGLAQYYRVTGNALAGKLCAKLARQVVHHSDFFGPDGAFLVDKVHTTDYFHGHTIALLGLLEWASVAGDRELIEFVRKSYECGKTECNTLVGFISGRGGHSETCRIADMLALALKLTDAGAGDYWDDVDRWVRNQFAESQLLRADWMYRVPKPQGRTQVVWYETAERVGERNIGAFETAPVANQRSFVMSACCTGNGTRAIYYVWEHILDQRDGKLRVNLLLNRASPGADVDSYIPYQGKVDVKVKQACQSVQVRVPEWIGSGSGNVACTVNGAARAVAWEGRYVSLGAAKAGDTVSVTFPIAERTEKTMIGKGFYTLVIRGNTVVAIDPPGEWRPLYRRDHLRESEPRWRKMTRFVADKQVYW